MILVKPIFMLLTFWTVSELQIIRVFGLNDCRSLQVSCLPQSAESVRYNRFGESGYERIKRLSPLTSGYWEVIITGKQSLQVACTADQNGVISDCVKGSEVQWNRNLR